MTEPRMGVDRLRVSRTGHVVVLRLDNPDRLNALTNELLEQLAVALEELDRDDEVRAIVVAGGEKAFASGADLRALVELDPADLYGGLRFRLWAGLRRLQTPLVAGVAGYCFGGGLELAMTCDVVIAAESAKFGQPETMLGLVPAAGGTQRLPRVVGRAKAMDMILTGRVLDAHEAEQVGIVSRVVGNDAWLAEAERVAHEIASRGPLANRLAKMLVNRSSDVSFEAGLDLERAAFTVAFGAAEAQEGIRAFLEKRPPSWQEQPDPAA